MAQKIFKGGKFTGRTFGKMTVFKNGSRFKAPNYFNGYTVFDKAFFIPIAPNEPNSPNIVRGYAVVDNTVLNDIIFTGPSTFGPNTVKGKNVIRIGPKIDRKVQINLPTIQNKKICDQSCEQKIINKDPVKKSRLKLL